LDYQKSKHYRYRFNCSSSLYISPPHHSLFGVAFSFCPFLSSHNITSSNNIIMLPIRPATRTTIVLLFLLLVQSSNSMQIFKYWAERHKCIAVIKPVWPFALAKSATQAYEEKGRSASNFQHLGHDCNTRGGRTKCRICEDIQCGPGQAQICPLQIQGMDATNLPKNIQLVPPDDFSGFFRCGGFSAHFSTHSNQRLNQLPVARRSCTVWQIKGIFQPGPNVTT
jgi:hypothetical protein